MGRLESLNQSLRHDQYSAGRQPRSQELPEAPYNVAACHWGSLVKEPPPRDIRWSVQKPAHAGFFVSPMMGRKAGLRPEGVLQLEGYTQEQSDRARGK